MREKTKEKEKGKWRKVCGYRCKEGEGKEMVGVFRDVLVVAIKVGVS